MDHFWLGKISFDQNDMVLLTERLLFYELEIDYAIKELKISGRFTKDASELPGLTAYRFNQLQELESLLQTMHIQLKSVKGKAFKRYFEAYNKTLTSRDAEKYADADKDVTALELLINTIALIRNQYLGVIKGLEVKHWQLSSIIKLKIAGFEDAELEKD